ncbi:MAG: hypothetical protein IJN49_02820, partial [Clostridia bacterium]|nr:hypothetical protein [Clostridia bacterium]
MKRIFILLFVVFGFFCFSVTAFAGDGDIDSYKDEFSYEAMISDIDVETVEILNSMGITELSYESIFNVTPKKVFDSFLEIFFNSFKEPLKYFLSVTGIMAIMALLTNLSRSPETVTLVGSSCVACFLAVPVVSLITRSFSVLEALSVFTSSFG